jgi:hypothetical protein
VVAPPCARLDVETDRAVVDVATEVVNAETTAVSTVRADAVLLSAA